MYQNEYKYYLKKLNENVFLKNQNDTLKKTLTTLYNKCDTINAQSLQKTKTISLLINQNEQKDFIIEENKKQIKKEKRKQIFIAVISGIIIIVCLI